MDRIIVSRHPAAIEFIARELGGVGGYATEQGPAGHIRVHDAAGTQHECGGVDTCYCEPHWAIVPVIASATAEEVAGKHVYGNLPLHLAAIAARVTVVEFEATPPRGVEYTLADMDAAGAVLRDYVVTARASAADIAEAEEAGLRDAHAEYVRLRAAADAEAEAHQARLGPNAVTPTAYTEWKNRR